MSEDGGRYPGSPVGTMSERREGERRTCAICGEPMPPGEEMFKYHGYSGPCPAPPLPRLTRESPFPLPVRVVAGTESDENTIVTPDGWTVAVTFDGDSMHISGFIARAINAFGDAPEADSEDKP
jgi:hypothetical protein